MQHIFWRSTESKLLEIALLFLRVWSLRLPTICGLPKSMSPCQLIITKLFLSEPLAGITPGKQSIVQYP